MEACRKILRVTHKGNRFVIAAATLAAIWTGAMTTAQAQNTGAAWPPATVRIVVPFGAGSTPDSAARVLAEQLKNQTGKQFVIENRAGAGGNTGTDAVAKGPVDGSLIGVSILGPLAMNKIMMASMPYNPDTDLAYLSLLSDQPSVLVVSNEMGVSNLKELIEKLRQEPGKYNYSSIGRGSLSHLSMELIAARSGTKVTHLPQKSSPEAAMAVMRNDVQMSVMPIISVLPLAREGKLKAIAVTSAQRFPAAPDIPTFAEAGLEGVVATAWNGLVAPAKTPPAMLSEMNAQVVKALNSAPVKAALGKMMMSALPTSREEMGKHVRGEFEKWSTIARGAGLVK